MKVYFFSSDDKVFLSESNKACFPDDFDIPLVVKKWLKPCKYRYKNYLSKKEALTSFSRYGYTIFVRCRPWEYANGLNLNFWLPLEMSLNSSNVIFPSPNANSRAMIIRIIDFKNLLAVNRKHHLCPSSLISKVATESLQRVFLNLSGLRHKCRKSLVSSNTFRPLLIKS